MYKDYRYACCSGSVRCQIAESATYLASICRYTISNAIPHLLALFNKPDEASHRSPILACLTGLLEASRESFTAINNNRDYDAERPLDEYKDGLLGAYSSGLTLGTCRRPALDGSLALVQIHGFLTPEELTFMVHNVTNLLDTPTDELDDLTSVLSNEEF